MALALANCCRWLGAGSMGAGWLNRAERLLAAEPEAVEHGYLDLARARSAEASAEFERSYEVAAATAELARRHGDRSVEALALHQMGYVRIWAGELDEGWALVDEATAAAVAGELTPHATATIYCGTISACRDLADFRRAAEWTEHVARWCERNARTGFPGICRLHRAEVMKLRGALAQAEEEVLVACRELADFNVSAAGSAFYELGEVRLRLGAFAAAEEAFQQAHELGREPQPGLALLRLAHGEAERARSCIARALAETEESLARVWLLPAAVDIELAAGDVERAEAAARELQEIGERYSSPLVLAGASCAAGAVALARGRANAARESLRVGRRIWQDLDAPYEAGQARVRLALAYRAAGDEEAARLELGSARSTFVRLGAVPALQTVEALLEPELTARPGT
jgi:tetratricopeptide (TPR) repeat protein